MTDEIPGKLLRLRESYRKKLPTYAEEIRACWARISEHGQEIVTQDMDALISLTHRLSGSGEAYGFVGVSKAARAVESACRAESIEEIRLGNLQAPIDELLSVLECDSVSQFRDHPESTANDDQPERLLGAPVRKVLLVDDDTDFMAQMTAVLERAGFAVVPLGDIEKFAETVAACAPLAAVVDMDFLGARYAGAQQVMAWRESDGAPLPVIFVSAHDSFEVRLAAIRAGGNHFLKKPIDESRLIHLLQAELRVGPEQPYRVLLVDDDEDLLALYQPILEKAGYRVFKATDAESAMHLAHRERPELALVDVSMPRCNGIELGQLIRQHEQLADMGLLFMSAYHDTDVELACARLADDEFIHKPVEWWRLLMVVRSRVERARRLRSQQLEQSQIKQFAALNPLTALPTRNAFQKALDARIRSSEQEQMLAVLKIDIRDFHEVNDLYGQFAGDETLQRIAWDISRTVANQDMLAHEGGDEYLLMMPALEERQEAFALAQSIQAVIANPARNDSEPTPLTADIGIALWPQDGTMADELLQCADTALFEARESHSPAIRYFSPEIQVEQQTRFALVKEIRQALADECFVAAYQPIFSVVNGRLLGFEALARWQHPQKGLLGPGSFIGAMEQQGLISGLTTQMLNGAIKQLAAWHNHGSELFVSVNLSAHDLQDSDLSTNIANLLKRYNIEASRLILEITESVLLEDWPQAFKVLTYLESLGVQVALDDFGTGYSSLNYLNRIRATKLKVDRGFIQSWSKNGDERLMRGIIQLGHSLGMDIVAEGVEDRSELAMLSGLKCGSYQGFLASKPLLKEEVVKQGWFLEKCFNGLS